jgi:hypothetical protein
MKEMQNHKILIGLRDLHFQSDGRANINGCRIAKSGLLFCPDANSKPGENEHFMNLKRSLHF